MCPESVGDALQRNSAAKYGEVKCLGLSRPNRKLRKRAGETKKKNGPSPLRGAERRSADLKFVGGAEGVVERGAALALHVPQKRDVLVIGVRGAQLRGRPALQLRLPAQLRGASRKNTAEFEGYCVLSAMHPTLTR